MKVRRFLVGGTLQAAILVAACFPPSASAAPSEPVAVRPSETDSRISTSDDPHFCWAPTGASRTALLLFLPGTGGKPHEHFAFADVAAELGYHVIFLMYPDGLAAQTACRNSADPDAHMKFRRAIIEGGPLVGKRTIDAADSIENRLAKVLLYLAAHRAGQGWEQFLDAGKQPLWERVALAGHSQGGGHAYVLGKIHATQRVLMFGSPKDYSFHFDRPATGFDEKTKTPLRLFFAFNHRRDVNGCSPEQQKKILAQMKLDGLGTADVDKGGAELGHAHVLYTDVDVPDSKVHSSVMQRQWAAVWRYMLTEDAK